ncbi:MAG: branched-chain amino acid ABC transporter ATP-binding protein/permease, partial [Actinomycetota bacterium]|nr:branched-chain amino acid ABC transporter ATP-binding protein/permease [Actinomycetota bacterium]
PRRGRRAGGPLMRRRLRRLAAVAGLAALIAFPYLPFVPFSVVGVAIQAAQIVVVTSALVMLTGWIGQISLGHAALVGIGAYATGWATGAWGLPFPWSTFVAGAVAAAFAATLGVVALRVRGLYLAVATLIFSWMADAFLFRVDTFVQHSSVDVPVIGAATGVPRFDLNDRRTMYYLAWGVALAILFLVANLRDSRTGRAFYAIKGSEIGAAALGIDVTRYKLLAFVLSGFCAGVAGNVIMLDSRSLSAEQFQFVSSLFYLSVAVVGGIASLAGGVASSLLFAALNEVFFRVRLLGDALDLVSAALLAVVLLLYRGGLAAVPTSVQALALRCRGFVERHQPPVVRRVATGTRHAVARSTSRAREAWAAAMEVGSRRVAGPATAALGLQGSRRDSARYRVRTPTVEGQFETGDQPVPAEAVDVLPVEGATTEPMGQPAAPKPSPASGRGGRVLLPPREERAVLLEARNITVRFGGLTAVQDVSLSVREHEIVGLIGPNGAGKTTLFNAIAGLNRPTAGEVLLFGEDVTDQPVHKRAEHGIARTFQAIQLFPALTVFENLLVATHLQNPTGFVRHALAVDSSNRAERSARDQVRRVIDQVGLGDVAHRVAGQLPFGVLRMVEAARALVTGAPMVMLDEPASGLDNAETDRFSEMLLDIRRAGVTLLLIEHDVRMVTALCDYIHVIDRGCLIAEGSAADVQSSPAVIAAYLGEADTDAAPPNRAESEEVETCAV